MGNYRVFCLHQPPNLSPRTVSEYLFIALVSEPLPDTKQFLKIMVNGMTWNLSGCEARTVFIYKPADPESRLWGLSCMFTEILEIRNTPRETRMGTKQARHASQWWNFSVDWEDSMMQYFKIIMNAKKTHSEQNIKICIKRININDFPSLPYTAISLGLYWLQLGHLNPYSPSCWKLVCLRWGSKSPHPKPI